MRPVYWGPAGPGIIWLETNEPFWAGFLSRCNIQWMSKKEEESFDKLSAKLQENAIQSQGITDPKMIEDIQQNVKVKKTALVFINNRTIQIRVNKEFMETLTPKQQAAVLKHEVAHPLQSHFSKLRILGLKAINSNYEAHAMVTDLEINDNIVNMEDPTGEGLSWKNIPELKGHQTAEEYLRKLMKQSKENNKNGKGQEGKQQEEQQQKGKGQYTISDVAGGGQEGINADDDSHKMSEDDIKQVTQKAVERGLQKSRGNIPGEVQDVVNAIMKPIINWEREIKKFQTHAVRTSWDETWSKKNRRLSIETWPGKTYQQQPRIAWGVDTSGSMEERVILQAIAESHKCAKVINAIIEVFMADTRIHDTLIIKPTDRMPAKIPIAGGGTSFVEVIEHVDHSKIKYDCLFYFTDTFGTFPPKPRVPVCWVVPVEYGEVSVPYGKLIRIQLREEK